ncbi:MAG TPA: type II toxin-antitoxin system VapC family toxin [Labilithrix sp.]|nr:type II toxin-antitoxin system VapC family toxin [Labilithrix sp.]
MAGTSFLLDTGVVLALMLGKDLGTRIDATYGLRASATRPAVCIVTYGELLAMAHANKATLGPKAEADIHATMSELNVINIDDDDVLQAYAEIYTHLRNHPKGSRTNVGENDMWIAAAARASDSTLLTLDKDFDPLEGEMIRRLYIERKPKRAT